MIVNKQAHQGDVYIKACKLPENCKSVDAEKDGKVILALGEQTGHHHRFEQDNVQMFHANDNSGRRFIVISENPATLYHEEHAPIEFAPGTYEIFIARQWTDENEPIAVCD